MPTAKEIGIAAVYSTVRGFAVLKGTPEDRIKIARGRARQVDERQALPGLPQDLPGSPPTSVVGRPEWQAQIDEFLRTGQEALATLGVTK